MAAISILFFGASAVAGKTIYVDADATGANNGSSWLNAYRYLQDALAAATTGDQILVAQGIYKPDKGQGITPGDRSASFRLINGLTLKGGYAGFGTPNPDARDVDTYKTILSGDLAGNDIEVADPVELMSEPTRSENSCNVVTASDCDRTTLLEGFTITAGNANFVIWSGGGIINGKPTISQCKITANSASSGGGIYFDHSAHTPGALLKDSVISHNAANSGGGIYNCAEIINCVISGNSAVDGYAGGIYLGSDCETSITDCIFSNNSTALNAGAVFVSFSGSEVIFTRCSFIGNSAGYEGGAIYSDGCTCGSYSTFYQCKFIANSAAGNGGAICDYGFTDMQLYSCLLVGNSSGENGGALCDEYDGGSALINCTVSNNTAAGQGGAICYDNYSYKGRRLGNTIIWANSDRNGQTHQYSQIYLIEVSELQDVTNCCIQVIPPEIKGQGNITSNPLFVDIDGPDNIPGNEDDNLHLLENSGCIDTGHNEYVLPQSSDLDGRPRIINGTVDRGAYEYAREQPGIIYVDDSATGANNGSSWADAYKYLQDALADANAAPKPVEIRVAQGIYRPDKGQGITPGDRTTTFSVSRGVILKGAYGGLGKPDPDQRNIIKYQTVLTGDLNGNDGPGFANYDENSFCVLSNGREIDLEFPIAEAVIDGFTITGGNANGPDWDFKRGGGIYFCYDCGYTLANCTIIRNKAEFRGGGMYSEGYGGCSSTIINCRFISNKSDNSGGGLCLTAESLPYITGCLFAGNSARWAGAISIPEGYPRIRNCTFSGNTASDQCGGIIGCVPLLRNCILWANTDSSGNTESAQIQPGEFSHIDYCCIQGWSGSIDGTGNIGANPYFANSNNGDYHLLKCSPCINAGDPGYIAEPNETDLDGWPRVVGGRIDMGAYEFQVPRILYVDDDATGANNGSSWVDAYKFLQDAIADASASGKPTEIRVAAGTYRPDQGVGQTSGDRNATFQLLNGVAIKGGYAGAGTPNPGVRDIRLYKTVLSGDLDGSMGELTKETFFDVMVPRYSSTTASYHVVLAYKVDSLAVLDGFTITGGVANGLDWDPITGIGTYDGGGIYCKLASPTVIDCIIRGNCVVFHAGGPGPMGGGMYNEEGNPTLIRCTFELNAADDYDSDSWAAGLMNHLGNIRLTDCVFAYNRTVNWGGGMANVGNAVLERCRFVGNFARLYGGAIYNSRGLLTMSNCLLEQNSSQWYPSGGIINYGRCEVTNCTFVRNSNYALVHSSGHQGDYIMVQNSIFWDGGQEIADTSGTIDVQVSYSDVQGGWPGQGNLNANPLFVDPNAGNYRLLPNSPCIDDGNNAAIPPSVTTDLDGRPRIIAGTVDMGAYEFYMLCVDDDAPADPGPGNPQISDPLEIGSEAHPFDSIQEAIDRAQNGYSVVVRPGSYLSSDQWTYDELRFCGKNIMLTSTDPADPEIVDNTILRGTVLFSGTEDPNCTLTGFKIQNPCYGAIYGEHTHATLDRCVISGNGPCGATVLKDWDGMVSNCLITDNATLLFCGVYPAVSGCNGHFKNCTIANNISGISVGNATIENCIIYYNAGAQIGVSNGRTLHIRYSNIQGGLEGIVGGGNVDWGPGNIDIDPCFVRLGYWVQKNSPPMLIEGDYHLKSQGWRWSKDSKSWTYDDVTSRCIDAGNPSLPLGDEPLTVPRDPENIWGENIRINMGAYGGTKQASMAPTPFALGPPEIGPWAFLADLNNDGTVNVMDVAGQVQDWLKSGTGRPGDLNRDGVVNMMDFALLAENWLSIAAWVE